MKMLKKILVLLLVLVVVAGAVLGTAAYNAKSLVARYRPEIEGWISQLVGARVSFGSVEPMLWPRLGLRATGVSVSDKGGKASLQGLELRAKILPLLVGTAEVTEATLVGPDVTVAKSASGVVRVAGLPDRPAATQTPAPTPVPRGDAASGGGFTVALESLRVVDGTVSFTDEKSGFATRVTDLDVDASLALAGQKVTSPKAGVSASVDGVGPVSAAAEDVAFDGAAGRLDAGSFAVTLPGGVVSGTAGIDTNTMKGAATVRTAGFDLGALSPFLAKVPAAAGVTAKGAVSADLAAELLGAGVLPLLKGHVEVTGVDVAHPQGSVTGLSTRITTDMKGDARTLEGKDLTLRAAAAAAPGLPADVTVPSYSFDLATRRAAVRALSAVTAAGTVTASSEADVGAKRGTFKVSTDGLDLAPLRGAVPALKDVETSGKVAADVSGSFGPGGKVTAEGPVRLAGLAYSSPAASVKDANGTIKLSGTETGVRATSDDLRLVLNDQPLSVGLDGTFAPAAKKVSVKNLSVGGLGGRTDLEADATLGPDGPFAAKVRAAGLDLPAVLKAAKPGPLPGAVKGALRRFDAVVRGRQGAGLMKSLTGDASVEIGETVLTGVNVAREILRKIGDVPFLAGSLLERVPPSFRAALDRDDTVIEGLSADVKLGGGVADVVRSSVKSDLFALTADGTYGLVDGALDLGTTVAFSPALSAGITEKVKELRAVTGPSGALTVPVAVSGVPPKLLVVPDVRKLVERAGRQVVKDKAGELLDKALGGGGKNDGAKDAIKGLLRGL